MSIEVILFLIVGSVSVLAAVGMLLSQNAVHSAMFLILNFVCVAFLYLMLDASFLALVQIAVYAGAIMVLFLFVIMLLNAELVGAEDNRQFKWLNPIALTLAMSFLIAVSLALFSGEIDSREIPEPLPLVRVAHAATGLEDGADIYLNDQLVSEGLVFRDASEFAEVEPGDYSVLLAVAGEPIESAFPIGEVSLERGQIITVVAYGESTLPTITAVSEDFSTIDGRAGRFIFFNAVTDSVDIVDAGSNFIIEPDENIDVIVEGLAFGTSSEVLTLEEGDLRGLVVPSDNTDNPILQLTDVEVERGMAELFIIAQEPATESNVSLRLTTDAFADFGGPRAIGQSLFTRYVLPFQMVAVLLLAAMVGAIVITQRGDIKPKPGRPTRRKVSRPLTSVIASQTGHDVYEDAAQPQLEAPDDTPEKV